ncbi:MAG: hypothetical protein IKO10_08200 [Lachnospiraceae bacterium]|nr:hypothetical protein [Lachnospiraceae bacterium]
MEQFMLLDAGLGNIVYLGGFLAIPAFLIGATFLIVRGVMIIRRELKNEQTGSEQTETPDEEHKDADE